MFTVDLKNQLEQYSKEVSEHLVEFLPKANDGQAQVVKAMRYSLLNGGKRLRPVFVLEFCKMSKKQWRMLALLNTYTHILSFTMICHVWMMTI